MISPLTIGLVAGGGQALGALTNFFGGQSKAAQANKARREQFKQQILIRDLRDTQRFDVYNQKKANYQQNLSNLTRRFGMEQMQDDLRMNELLKGSKLASQNKLVNEVQQVGKISGRGVAGNSAAKMKQSALASLGRQAQVRQDQMVSSQYAKQLKDEARFESLDASRMKAFNQVAFAPQRSAQLQAPTMESGPSPYSLIAGIGGAALSGLQAGMGQANFNDQLLQSNPTQMNQLNPGVI